MSRDTQPAECTSNNTHADGLLLEVADIEPACMTWCTVWGKVQDEVAGKHLVSEDAALAYGGQQEVVWQEVQPPRSYMSLRLHKGFNYCLCRLPARLLQPRVAPLAASALLCVLDVSRYKKEQTQVVLAALQDTSALQDRQRSSKWMHSYLHRDLV